MNKKTVMVLAGIAVVALLLFLGYRQQMGQKKTYELAEDALEGGYVLPTQDAAAGARGQTPSYFTIMINASPTTDRYGRRCNLMIGNPEENNEYARVRLVLEETGEEIFYSELLKPGERNAYVTLTKVPEPGIHKVTATFVLFDPDSMEESSEIDAGIELTVGS